MFTKVLKEIILSNTKSRKHAVSGILDFNIEKLFVNQDRSDVKSGLSVFKSAYNKSIKRIRRGINAKKMARPEKNRHSAADATPPRVKNSSILP